MSVIFAQLFSCCIRNRFRNQVDGPIDEHSRLLPVSDDAPVNIRSVVVVDHRKLNERLGSIVRVTEGKMVNVNAQIPFHVHHAPVIPVLSHRSSSRSAPDHHHERSSRHIRRRSSPESSLHTARSTSSANVNDDVSSSIYVSPGEADENADVEPKNPILNVRLIRGVRHVKRVVSQSTRELSTSEEFSHGVLDNRSGARAPIDGSVDLGRTGGVMDSKPLLDAQTRPSPQLRSGQENSTDSGNIEVQPTNDLSAAGDITCSWGD